MILKTHHAPASMGFFIWKIKRKLPPHTRCGGRVCHGQETKTKLGLGVVYLRSPFLRADFARRVRNPPGGHRDTRRRCWWMHCWRRLRVRISQSNLYCGAVWSSSFFCGWGNTSVCSWLICFWAWGQVYKVEINLIYLLSYTFMKNYFSIIELSVFLSNFCKLYMYGRLY